jgi:hypothetical protein
MKLKSVTEMRFVSLETAEQNFTALFTRLTPSLCLANESKDGAQDGMKVTLLNRAKYRKNSFKGNKSRNVFNLAIKVILLHAMKALGGRGGVAPTQT